MDLCCHEAMVKHYKELVVLAEEKNMKFSKDDVNKVDMMVTEMGVICPDCSVSIVNPPQLVNN